MTTIAGTPREPVISSRAPYAPIVMLVGAALVIGVFVRLLNTDNVPAYPLSGAPVGDGTAAVVVRQGAPRSATGSLSLLLPLDTTGERLPVGPAAFPPGAEVVLSTVLPTDEPSTVTISLSRLAEDGTLVEVQPVAIAVNPDSEGVARVSASVDVLAAELGSGIYRIRLLWDGQQIGGTDVALGLFQPSGVAIFNQPRQVSFAAGEHIGVRADANGRAAERKPYVLKSASGAPAGAYAQFSGTPHVLITAGVWAGYWMPLSDSVTLN